jgi:hypothetical protein
MTKPHELGGYKQIFISLSSGVWDQGAGMTCFLILRGHLLTVSSHRRHKVSLEVSFVRTLIPFARTPSSWPNHSQGPDWVPGFNMWIWGTQMLYPKASPKSTDPSLLRLLGLLLRTCSQRNFWFPALLLKGPVWKSLGQDQPCLYWKLHRTIQRW